MTNKCLVTGANGHLGNTLVRILLDKGEDVRASVRDVSNSEPFKELKCEVVYADLLDRQSLSMALENVHTLYQVAASYQLWSKNPMETIILNNIEGTRNILEIAAVQGIRKVIYVSSTAALDHRSIPMKEETWNQDFSNPYYQSKTESEKMAIKLAKELGLWLVSILPAAMVGPNCSNHLTPTMDILNAIVKNRIPFDVNFYFNYVDVNDVAHAMIAAGKKGRCGERYILANETSTSTTEIFELANSLLSGIKKPSKRSKHFVMALAFLMETASMINGKAPNITRSIVRTYYGADQSCDISKARNELGFNPRSPIEALKEALLYLAERVA